MEQSQPINYVHGLLKALLEKKGSDLFITAHASPSVKVDGRLTRVSSDVLTPQITQQLVRAMMNDNQAKEFDRSQECNFAISLPGQSRFRVNAFWQRGSVGAVIRTINNKIPSLEDLKLPPILKEIVMTKRGLVIFVGGTGSGKTTSLAAMIGHRNEHSYGHIVTIEDPIEFSHSHRNCLITQREVGVDTSDYEAALKNTLRQAPDVILIGEIRERETMNHAIAFAETGHLCLSTLHANNANQALDRIINFFPEERRAQLLMDLSLNVKAFVSQRLIPCAGGQGRIAAVEVMLNSPYMAQLILKGEIHQIKALIAKSTEMGMQTFDQHLFKLYEDGEISYEDALRHADSLTDLRLRIKLQSTRSPDKDALQHLDHLSIEPKHTAGG